MVEAKDKQELIMLTPIKNKKANSKRITPLEAVLSVVAVLFVVRSFCIF